ncbi:DNA primase [Spirochaetia bacterium]|nr:DNA primase [Spirochaetia bacterium]
MRISDASIQEVKDKADAVSVVGDYVRLDKKSGQYWGCCPFHNEKTPSFKVDPDKKLFYCFGCHKSGSIIDFVMEMDKTSYPETIELLAKKFGVELIYEGREGEEASRNANARKDELYELYRRVAGSFHHLLMEKAEGSAAKAYIIDRGIDAAMIEHFRLGYSPSDRSWLFRFLKDKGYSPEFLASSGLFSAKYPKTAFFSNRLMFPIADRQGRTVAFGARLLSGEGPKYLNSLESEVYKKGQTLFAIDQALPEIRRTRAVYIAEGYMDVIALHQAGITNAAAPLGTAFTDDQAKLLKRWAEQVYLVFDSDEAGQTAAVKGILTCRKNGLACSVVIPGQGLPTELVPTNLVSTNLVPTAAAEKAVKGEAAKDPADILKNFGAGALQESVKNCIIDFEYLVNRARFLFDTSSGNSGSGGKAKAVAFLFPYVEVLDSAVSKEACLGEIADAFGVERQAVQADFGRRGRDAPKRVTNPGEVPSSTAKPVHMNEELFLLTAVVLNHGLYPKLRSTLSIEELEDPQAKDLFIALEEWFRDGAGRGDLGLQNEATLQHEATLPTEEAALPHDLLSRIHDEALRNFVIEQGVTDAFSRNPDLLVEKSIRRVRQKGLERRQAGIIIELRTQNRGESGRSLEDLLLEKVHIDAELLRLKDAAE